MKHGGLVTIVLIGGMVASTARGGSLSAFGLIHDPLGNAELTVVDGTVVVSGLDASGNDGVAIPLGDASGWRAAVDFGPAGAIARGASIDLVSDFAVDGDPTTAHLSIRETDGGLAAIHLLDVDCACAVTIELRLHGAVVDTVASRPPFDEIARGAFGATADAAPVLRTERTTDDRAVVARAFTLTNPEPTLVTLAGSVPTLGDEIRVRLDGAPGGTVTAQTVSVTAANLETFTLGDEAIVQLGADFRAVGGLAFSGTIVPGTGAALFAGNIDQGSLDDRLAIRPSEAPSSPVSAFDVRFDFATGDEPLYILAHEVFGHTGDDDSVPIIESLLWMPACGCNYGFHVYDPPADSSATKVVHARLGGREVDLASPPGAAMWYTSILAMPDAWSFEVDPDAAPGTFIYREICRWDEPATITIFGGSSAVVVDEVEVTVTGVAAPGEAAVAIDATVLTPASTTGLSSFIITGLTFRSDGVPCLADLDADGAVGPGDLAALLAAWGACPGCGADLDGDGVVGPADLAALLASWGPCPA